MSTDESAVNRMLLRGEKDLLSAMPESAARARRPLRLVYVSGASVDGLGVVLRAIAVARARGVDARLTVWRRDDDTPSRPFALRHSVDDRALGMAVECRVDPFGPERFTDFHAVLDDSPNDMDRDLIEALTNGIPVVSSNKQLGSLLLDSPIPLQWRAGDFEQLSERIVTLSRLWSDELGELRDALRSLVERADDADACARELTAIGAPTSSTDDAPPQGELDAISTSGAGQRHRRLRVAAGVGAVVAGAAFVGLLVLPSEGDGRTAPSRVGSTERLPLAGVRSPADTPPAGSEPAP